MNVADKKWAKIVLLIVLIMFLFIGCGIDEPEAGDKNMQIAEYTSEHYKVYLVGSRLPNGIQEKNRQVALLMEQMFKVYAGLDEMPLPVGDPMPIWLHLSRKEYDYQAALYGFPPKVTAGFCTTEGVVHVYYKGTEAMSPISILLHEGFHQYCHRAIYLSTPPKVYEKVPGYKNDKLVTVPLWLNEGIAVNMETARVVSDHNGYVLSVDDSWSVNRPRLRRLVELIKNNRCPSIRTTMSLVLGDQINNDDYAVMWGLVFDLRFATGNSIFIREQEQLEKAGKKAVENSILAATDPTLPIPYMRWPVPIIGRFLRASRIAWGLDIPQLVDLSVYGANEPRDFDRQWNRHITLAALNEFEKLLLDNGVTLDEWEKSWRLRMLTLYADIEAENEPVLEEMQVESIVTAR